eukprot:UN4336
MLGEPLDIGNCAQAASPPGGGRSAPLDVVLGVALVAGPLHGKVPVEVLHLTLLLDEVLTDAVERHDERVPILAVDLLLKRDLIPLQVTVLAFVAVVNGDGGKLQHLLQLLLRNVNALLPVLNILVVEVDLAPRVLGLADRDLHHGCKGARVRAALWETSRAAEALEQSLLLSDSQGP